MKLQEKIFSVAPMMDWTDRHCRFFHRLLTRRTQLYTEMVTTGALIHGLRDRLLGFDQAEQPLALQLGGSEPADMALCAGIGEDWGYTEINMNVGCPSERVLRGAFGACLMREPKLVGDCVAAMQARVKIPVTVKCRIGVDEQDPDEALFAFIGEVAKAGCTSFVVHARKAILRGLSPKDNREIPPLNYDVVYRVKRQWPELKIILNGGVKSIAEAEAHLAHVDGVMMGRAAYQTPWLLAEADERLFGEREGAVFAREDALERFLPYAEEQLKRGVPLHTLTRHILGLYHGVPGAKMFRRYLSEQSCRRRAGLEVFVEALNIVRAHSVLRDVA